MRKILLVIAGLLVTLAGGYGISELGAGVNTGERIIMNEVATTTVGSVFVVNDYKDVSFVVATTANSSTVKFACSQQEDVNFATSASATNRWDYVDVTDMEDNASIDGDTGVTYTNATDVRQFKVTATPFYGCTALSTWTAGTSTITMRPFTNQ